MDKSERILQFVAELVGEDVDPAVGDIAQHPYYRAFFTCWNEQRYYEAHDVLEQVWLGKAISPEDAQYFKGLIQAAGAFVHLQKHYEHPTHAKHGKRLGPAVRLFRLAEKNLAPFGSTRHELDVARFRQMLGRYCQAVVDSEQRVNPWTPETAPRVSLGGSGAPSRDVS